jgi:putative endopeptidase
MCVTIGLLQTQKQKQVEKQVLNAMKKHNRAITVLALVGAFIVIEAPFAHSQANSTVQSTVQADKNSALPTGLDARFLDTTADPCGNFAQYACGNFAKVFPIPADMSAFDPWDVVFQRNELALRALLEKLETDSPSRTPNEKKVGDFYASCMDYDAVQTAGLTPFQPDLDRIAAMKTKSELTGLLARFELINVNAFFGYGEQQDFKDARKQIADVDQGGLGLPERDYYLRTGDAAEKTRQQYVQHLTNTLKLLGEPEAKAVSDAQSIMKLETALARISMDVESRRDPKNIYHLMTVSQLAELTPEIDWTDFFTRSGAPPVTEVNVKNPDFFKGLAPLLESTDLETIKTYLRWHLLTSIPRVALPAAFGEERFNFFERQLRGQLEDRARWKRCAQETDTALGEALGEAYVKAYFPPESKAKTLQMVKDIENAMDKEIDTLDWMSSGTKIKAKEKLRLIADKVGYPDHWRDYSSLKIVRGDAAGNVLRGEEFESRRELAKIGKPVDRGEWGMTPPTVNAYYDPSMNDINFPAGILQPPLFSPNSTDAENYGHIGGTIGHELTHGFDDQGRKFDGNGNLSDWWTAEDAKKFEVMTDCEVKEYGSFTAVEDVKLNGKLTLGENTADNGGLRLAWVALLADAKRNSTDLNARDGSGYTPAQQFFLAHGQQWCGGGRPEQIRLQVQTDEHSPDKFRINGVVQNMPEFGRAFGCKTGQTMMPANACHVW